MCYYFFQEVNISTVIAERLKVQTALASNPFNIEAIAKLRDCDDKIKKWSKSGLKPAQFTGEKTKNILTKEELEGGYSAWVRKVSSLPSMILGNLVCRSHLCR